jgi:TIR domain
MSRTEVFLSYSHADKVWRDRLAKHLRVLEKQDILAVWDDGKISAGVRWEEEILRALDSAQVVVILVSADFLGSDFILGVEVPKILERLRAEELKVVPILVRECTWEAVPWLAEMQIRPENAVPLIAIESHELDATLKAVVWEVWKLVEADRLGTSTTSPKLGKSA